MKNYKSIKFILSLSGLLILSIIFNACSTASSTTKENELGYSPVTFPYYEVPVEFSDSSLLSKKFASYSEYLSGKKIILDPGHGGSDRKNTSRDSSVIEADINLKVALYLRDFLTSAGAFVKMTRDTDETLSLEQRSEVANNSGCELFLSVHHNAVSDKGNYWTNYTSTFYHSKKNDYDYEQYEHTLAKYIQRDLAYAMRNPGPLISFDGTMSDYDIHDGVGFAVLRNTSIPSVLVECSFFTNRLEETRLSIEEFNKVEAWGIFCGIAKFFRNDFLDFSINQVESFYSDDSLKLIIKTDPATILSESDLSVWFNKELIDFTLSADKKMVEIALSNIVSGEHEIKIVYNNDEITAKPFNRKILIK